MISDSIVTISLEKKRAAFADIGVVKSPVESLRPHSVASITAVPADLLLKVGCGGSFEDAERSAVQSGDRGIDGRIREERLDLDQSGFRQPGIKVRWDDLRDQAHRFWFFQ